MQGELEDRIMVHSQPLTPVSPPLPMDGATGTTWGERLLMNLFSYSLVLAPMAFVVLTTRYKLCPTPLQSSALVQWFVYGSSGISQSKDHRHPNGDQEGLLLPSSASEHKSSSNITRRKPFSTLVFIWCFAGLQISYLIWGVLQEKIMTTEYPVTSGNFVKSPTANPLGSSGLTAPGDNSTMHLLVGSLSSSPSSSKSGDGGGGSSTTQIITFHDSQFLVFVNRIIAFILSIIPLVYNRPRKSQLLSGIYNRNQPPISNHNNKQTKSQAPLYEYAYCSLSNILSSWCQYEALKYVNFPTQVLSKSCKIVPVMLMSKIISHKKYQLFDYLCALLLSVGMFIFLLNQPVGSTRPHHDVVREPISSAQEGLSTLDNQSHNQEIHDKLHDKLGGMKAGSSLLSGLVILALYLAFDSFTSNWQESLLVRYGMSKWQMMAATNFYSILFTLTSLYQLGTLKPAFKLLASSTPLLLDVLLMSIMSSIGQLFVFFTIDRFGSVKFTVIMTLRQFLAILLSCAIYGHRLTLGSCAGLLLVVLVVGYQTRRKLRGVGGGGGGGSKNRVGALAYKAEDRFQASRYSPRLQTINEHQPNNGGSS